MNINNLFLCPIFKKIPVDERENFLNELKFTIKRFKKGGQIAAQGEAVKYLYILLKGSVKAEMFSVSGTVLNIETISAPSPLAPAFLFAENNQFPVDVVALENCEIMLISKSTIMQQFARYETFLQGYITFNSNRVYFLSERLKMFSIKTLKGKIVQYILERRNNLNFTLDKNRTVLAEYFCVARPSLCRSLAEMVDEGVITLKGNNGKILSVEKLKELITQ
ncbi:MAG: Crp/Fnr family transcriptional regulator [Bacteroidales bacterium]|jgi:CRP-like cAMP-binding protein|nr:Crp/Fnr family transcriptional regulator [Bacteroidales bacterium]